MSDWKPVVGWVPKGDNLTPLLREAGVEMLGIDGVLHSNNPELALQINAAFDFLADRKAAKLKELADFRWQKEIGGIVYNNLRIETTDRSKTLVTGAMLMAAQNPATTFQFKTTDDQYVEVAASDMLGIYAAIGLHVQSCFAKEQTVADQIKALTDVDAVIAFDFETAWPA